MNHLIELYNLVIKNGRVIDGTGSPWFKSDIGVNGGKISKVARNLEGEETVDATGLIVSPGWIDVHMHADHTVLGNTRLESYIHQGITTATMGNCGLSMYPLRSHRGDIKKYLKPFTSGLNLSYDWTSMEDFLNKIESSGLGINLVPFVGHGSIRINAMGFDARPPTRDELADMKNLLEEALVQGAHGMSTGLGYPPGTFTEDPELIELSHILKEHNGLYTTHMRSRVNNLSETIILGYSMSIPIQVSHLGSSCASNSELNGKHSETTLKAIDEARSMGLDITADIYPYTAGSSLLSQYVPAWAQEGGVNNMLIRLRQPEVRERFKAENLGMVGIKGDFSKIHVTYVKTSANKKYEGMSVTEIAEQRGTSPVDTFCDILLEEEAEAMNVTFWGEQDDVDTLVKHPTVMPCSDGWSHAPYGPLSQGRPHPRCYGAFPRYLHTYAVEKNLFTLEEAIRRMSSMPASRLNLQNRGLLKEGMVADLTLFNPKTVRDTATFKEPHKYPDGIPIVIIDGKIVIEQGEHTGILAGKILRKVKMEP